MQLKQNALKSLMRAGLCATLALGAVAVYAADATGKWTWTGAAGRNGNPGPTYTLELKADGKKLTGALTSPPRGRGGGDPTVTQISNGSVDGDKIKFDVVIELPNGGNSITNSYEGTVSGDTIKGTQPPARGRGRRGGPGGPGGAPADTSTPPPAPPARQDWTATRVK